MCKGQEGATGRKAIPNRPEDIAQHDDRPCGHNMYNEASETTKTKSKRDGHGNEVWKDHNLDHSVRSSIVQEDVYESCDDYHGADAVDDSSERPQTAGTTRRPSHLERARLNDLCSGDLCGPL